MVRTALFAHSLCSLASNLAHHSVFTPTHREDLLESMDVARDLHLVGGLAPLIEVLRSDNPDLRCGAANALAVW